MALVVKSWHVTSQPVGAAPHVEIVGRESGIGSFIFSLLGIDATTTFTVGQHRMEFQRGSLSGFERRLTPFEHVSSTFYGRHKPWKSALAIFAFAFVLGVALMGHSTGTTIFGTLILFGGVGLAAAYYVLNRELMIGFYESNGDRLSITFNRSVIEGQEVDESGLENIIKIIEHKLSPDRLPMPDVNSAARPAGVRMASPAPKNLQELVMPPAQPIAVEAGICKKCSTKNSPSDAFCSSCGTALR